MHDHLSLIQHGRNLPHSIVSDIPRHEIVCTFTSFSCVFKEFRKLQALQVYHIPPPTIALAGYVIGFQKHSAN